MPIGADELAAYFNAAIGVTAFDMGVLVQRLSLQVKDGKRDRPRLMSLHEYIRSRIDRFNCIKSAFDFVTVLLAGTVGRVIGLERYLAYPAPHLEMSRLKRAYLEEARLCREPETDSALAITVAWLKIHNCGNADATFAQLWLRAELMLRTDPHRHRLDLLAAELKKKRVILGKEISQLLTT